MWHFSKYPFLTRYVTGYMTPDNICDIYLVNIWTKYFYSKVYQIKVISIETKKNNVNTIRIILQNIFLKLLYLWLKIVLEVENIYLGHDLHFITGKPPQLKTICPVHVLQFYYNNWKCLSHLNLWISLIILICIYVEVTCMPVEFAFMSVEFVIGLKFVTLARK